MTKLALPAQHGDRRYAYFNGRGGNEWTLLTAQRCPRTTALSNATVASNGNGTQAGVGA
jgi:hypothetical protein